MHFSPEDLNEVNDNGDFEMGLCFYGFILASSDIVLGLLRYKYYRKVMNFLRKTSDLLK